MNYTISAVTDIGLTKNTNQDSCNARIYNTSMGQVVFAIMCDGMGGLSNGEVASASVVKGFCRWADTELEALCEKGIEDQDIRNAWVSLAEEYNEKLKQYGRECRASAGTTLTAILITESRYYVINIGDSRAYEISDCLYQITRDQTVVAKEVEEGYLTEEQAETDSRRSILLQCVGASESIVPDMFFGETKPNAVYMLCSDGFRHEITKDEIYAYLNPEVMVNRNMMQANMTALIDLNKQRQERDNITVVAVRTF